MQNQTTYDDKQMPKLMNLPKGKKRNRKKTANK